MHLGRNYPYAFKYWVPEWRFWPGKSPNWVKGIVSSSIAYTELTRFQNGLVMFSFAGEVDVSGRNISYQFTGLPAGCQSVVSLISNSGLGIGTGSLVWSFSDPIYGDGVMEAYEVPWTRDLTLVMASMGPITFRGTHTPTPSPCPPFQIAPQVWSDPRP